MFTSNHVHFKAYSLQSKFTSNHVHFKTCSFQSMFISTQTHFNANSFQRKFDRCKRMDLRCIKYGNFRIILPDKQRDFSTPEHDAFGSL